ncbi:MAG: hypothetical protein Q4B28_05190 [bacterium]|nr:hypothetical protein [bacterium]
MAVAGATEAGEWALSGLDKVFGKAGEIVNHLPVLKQFRDSLSEEDKKRFDSFIGGSVTALF